MMMIGPFELLESVGSGGMGTVYRARHCKTRQIVAVKVMTAEAAANPLLLKRFEQEFAAVSRLRHPHMVQGLDFAVENGRPYLVMEFVDGQNLGERIREQGCLSAEVALPIIFQVADALHAAHQSSLIHRDIKPENILLTRDGQAKLVDLGLVKDLSTHGELTWARTALGTVAYMAPEQFEDASEADVRCDVYGLGATLYHAVTGIAPFHGRVNLVVLRKKLLNEFVPPQRIVPSLPAHVSQAICRALDASPANRQSSCKEFIASLAETTAAEEAELGYSELLRGEEALLPDPDPDKRQGGLRYPSELEVSCRLIQGGKAQLPAEIQDVSQTGLRLRLNHRFDPGDLLAVEIAGQQSGPGLLLSMRVCWVRASDTARWELGCAFTAELSKSELNTVLGSSESTAVIFRS
jgi:serine/threonine protein kinase